MKVSEFVLTEAYTYSAGNSDTRTLPEGAFVKPIRDCYVPKHILDDRQWQNYEQDDYTFAYCRYGIILLPRRIIREVL